VRVDLTLRSRHPGRSECAQVRDPGNRLIEMYGAGRDGRRRPARRDRSKVRSGPPSFSRGTSGVQGRRAESEGVGTCAAAPHCSPCGSLDHRLPNHDFSRTSRDGNDSSVDR
jgi:hypothetical protein